LREENGGINGQKELALRQFLSYLDLKEAISIGNNLKDTICFSSSGVPRFEKIGFISHKLSKTLMKRPQTAQITIFSPITKKNIPGETLARFNDGSQAISTDGVQLFLNFDPVFSFLAFSREFDVTTGNRISKINMQIYNRTPRLLRSHVRKIYRKKDRPILPPEEFIGSSNNSLILLIENFLMSQGLARQSQKETPIILSHDIDTIFCQDKGINYLLQILDKYNIPATWFFVPFCRDYKLDSSIIDDLLSKEMELGLHGHSHDGLLDKIPTSQIIQRLKESRNRMSDFGINISVFRSPFMFRSRKIMKSLRETGFKTDSSYPDKNTLSLTKKQKGVEYNRPFIPLIDNEINLNKPLLVEIPSCYPQDVQIFEDFNIQNNDAFQYWKYKFDFVKDFRGVFIFHGHPRYLVDHSELYEKLIRYLRDQNTIFTSFCNVRELFLKRFFDDTLLNKISFNLKVH